MSMIFENPMAIAAFLCAVAAIHIVVMRTVRNKDK